MYTYTCSDSGLFVSSFLNSSCYHSLQPAIQNAGQRSVFALLCPTGHHHLPALLVKHGQALRPQASLHLVPQLILALAAVVGIRQTRLIAADVPEENAKCVDIHRHRIRAAEELRRHVDGGADHGACHHSFRLAKSKIGQLPTVSLVQL